MAPLRRHWTSIRRHFAVPAMVLLLTYVGVLVSLLLLGSVWWLAMSLVLGSISMPLTGGETGYSLSIREAILASVPLCVSTFSRAYSVWLRHPGPWLTRIITVIGIGVLWPQCWVR
jgi:hypothetical protein